MLFIPHVELHGANLGFVRHQSAFAYLSLDDDSSGSFGLPDPFGPLLLGRSPASLLRAPAVVDRYILDTCHIELLYYYLKLIIV